MVQDRAIITMADQ